MTDSNITQMMVVAQAAQYPGQFTKKVSLYNADGTVLSVVGQTSAGLVLTGYTVAGAVAAVAATDTLNVALGKLQKSINSRVAAAQVDFVGADLAALKVELNAFLAKLRAGGIVAP